MKTSTHRHSRIIIAILIIFLSFLLVDQIEPGTVQGDTNLLTAIPLSDCLALQNMKNDLTDDYELTADIDCSATAGWNSGLGFEPVGMYGDPFTGSLIGHGYTIHDLAINRTTIYGVGLFGVVGSGAEIQDVHLVDINIVGTYWVGGLAGDSSGSISDVTVNGVITGSNYAVGGLTGRNDHNITRASSEVTVTSLDQGAGGLVGGNYGTIRQSYATGPVVSEGDAGGLVGRNGGTIDECYATSSVHSEIGSAGGLVAENGSGGLILNAYAMGDVSGGIGTSLYIGGLVGLNEGGLGGPGIIRQCYSAGYVSGGSINYLGGLVGENDAGPDTVIHSYWDMETSALSSSEGGTGKTTLEMKIKATFENWPFLVVWSINETQEYPQLRFQAQSRSTVMLPALMRSNRQLYIKLGVDEIENGIYLYTGADRDTMVYVFGVNPDLSFHATGNGEILPSADGNQVADQYMQFGVDDAFMFAEPSTSRVRVELTYKDKGTDGFFLQYDGHSGGPTGDGRFRSTGTVTKMNTGQIKTVIFDLDEVYFANRTNGGDFRIADMHDGEELIRMVTIRWLTPGP